MRKVCEEDGHLMGNDVIVRGEEMGAAWLRRGFL